MYMCVYLLVPFMLVMRKKKQGGLGWAVNICHSKESDRFVEDCFRLYRVSREQSNDRLWRLWTQVSDVDTALQGIGWSLSLASLRAICCLTCAYVRTALLADNDLMKVSYAEISFFICTYVGANPPRGHVFFCEPSSKFDGATSQSTFCSLWS